MHDAQRCSLVTETESFYEHTMGDKSPKANQKKTSQKQSKNNSADQKKKQATAAKQAPKPTGKK
jgi:hypothetical protein